MMTNDDVLWIMMMMMGLKTVMVMGGGWSMTDEICWIMGGWWRWCLINVWWCMRTDYDGWWWCMLRYGGGWCRRMVHDVWCTRMMKYAWRLMKMMMMTGHVIWITDRGWWVVGNWAWWRCNMIDNEDVRWIRWGGQCWWWLMSVMGDDEKYWCLLMMNYDKWCNTMNDDDNVWRLCMMLHDYAGEDADDGWRRVMTVLMMDNEIW